MFCKATPTGKTLALTLFQLPGLPTGSLLPAKEDGEAAVPEPLCSRASQLHALCPSRKGTSAF